MNYEYEFLTDPLYGTRNIPNINRERTNNSTTAIYLNYGITERISLALLLPFRSVTNEKMLFRGQDKNQYEGGKYIRHASGLGDMVVMLNYLPALSPKWPALFVGAGVKLANGSIEATDKYGVRFSDNLQIGSGSLDPVFALNVSKGFRGLIFSETMFTRISMRENIYGYKYGNELHSIFSIDTESRELFYGGVSLNYLLTTRDYYEYGKITRERGGTWLYLAPKLGIKTFGNMNLEVRLPFAIYQNVNESQLTSAYQLQINAIYNFTL